MLDILTYFIIHMHNSGQEIVNVLVVCEKAINEILYYK